MVSRRNLIYNSLICFLFVMLGTVQVFKAESIPTQIESIKIGLDRGVPPLEFEENDQPTGFCVDIVNSISDSFKSPVEFIFMEWPDVLESVNNGSLDAMFAMDTPSRRVFYDFSIPFINISLRVFNRKDQPNLKNIRDLENHTVAVVEGVATQEYLENLDFQVHILVVDSLEDGLSLLSKGDVYAFFEMYHVGLYAIKDGGFSNIKPTEIMVDSHEQCIAVKKGNSELLTQINDGLNKITENQTYAQIYEKWFGKGIIPEISTRFIQVTTIVIGGLILGFISLTAWNYTLKKKIEEKSIELKESNKLLLRQDKMKSISILAGGIAHDFNNYLTTILGNISLAKIEMDDDIPMRDNLIEAENASLQAKNLTRQLMTFSKGGKPVKKTINIASIIQQSCTFPLHGTDIKLKLNIAEDIMPIYGDEGQITQVINNLVLNAKQAMENGGTIYIEAKNRLEPIEAQIVSPEKKYIEILVQDEGIGIPEENLTKIFDPYFTTKSRGTGLGLSICHNIIENHGGVIEVKSKQPLGTSFRILLPVSEESLEYVTTNMTDLVLGKGKIIIMDDQRSIRTLLKQMLEKLGFETETAINGKETIQKVEQSKLESGTPPIVILDITIPGGMGGIETMEILRKKNPSIKAIISSGYSNLEVMRDFKKYGFLGILPKPFSLLELNKVLKSIMDT